MDEAPARDREWVPERLSGPEVDEAPARDLRPHLVMRRVAEKEATQRIGKDLADRATGEEEAEKAKEKK